MEELGTTLTNNMVKYLDTEQKVTSVLKDFENRYVSSIEKLLLKETEDMTDTTKDTVQETIDAIYDKLCRGTYLSDNGLYFLKLGYDEQICITINKNANKYDIERGVVLDEKFIKELDKVKSIIKAEQASSRAESWAYKARCAVRSGDE